MWWLKMICPFCSKNDIRVLESREVDEFKIRRRRECVNCEGRFTTYETVEQLFPRIIKKDGTIQIFDKNKIKKGLIRACEKRKISSERIDEIINKIEISVRKKGKSDIKSTEIGTMIMNKLKNLDKVAYIRFASVYKDFQDVSSFKEEINKLN
jgi:transcriptional repressor NrdR